jgi:hypothetical protein
LPVAPSALSPDAKVWVVGDDGVDRMVDCPVPRALATAEIAGVIDDFRRAAANAMRAGFDGVEIHGANGYLIDQFLRTTSNHRTDAYGGTMDNRTRFAREMAAAVASEAGAERTGMRLAPFITQRNMNCPEIIPTMLHLARQLDTLGLAYIHLAEADWDDAPPAWVRATSMRSEPNQFPGRDAVNPMAGQLAARDLYKMGRIQNPRQEIDCAEIYVPFSWFEAMWMENLGFAPENEGWKMVYEGATALDGDMPINMSGGVLSTNAIGASGMVRYAEAAMQVRGQAGEHQVDGARVSMGHAYGGGSQYFSMCLFGAEKP